MNICASSPFERRVQQTERPGVDPLHSHSQRVITQRPLHDHAIPIRTRALEDVLFLFVVAEDERDSPPLLVVLGGVTTEGRIHHLHTHDSWRITDNYVSPTR